MPTYDVIVKVSYAGQFGEGRQQEAFRFVEHAIEEALERLHTARAVKLSNENVPAVHVSTPDGMHSVGFDR